MCAECVRVCEDAIARPIPLLILKSDFIYDFLLAEEMATLISPVRYFLLHPYILIGILE